MDKNERAHMDYNRENGTITFIYNVLDLERTRNITKPYPWPLSFKIRDSWPSVIRTMPIIEQMVRYLESHELSIYKLLLQVLKWSVRLLSDYWSLR